jgi:hypothetical protein
MIITYIARPTSALDIRNEAVCMAKRALNVF